MKTTNVFDVETGPLPEADLEAVKPAFEPAKNLKDPEKIKASIAEKEAAWREGLALSPFTGQILCIGIMEVGELNAGLQCLSGPEKEILNTFWTWLRLKLFTDEDVIGWSCHHFDLPFLVKRSLKWGVATAPGLRTGNRFQYWHPQLVDAQLLWQMGDRQCECSLGDVAKFLGLPPKLGDGKDFHKLWVADRQKAEEYVRRDLELTRTIYERLLTQPLIELNPCHIK